MVSFRVSETTILTLIESKEGLDDFVAGRAASMANVLFGDRLAIVQSIAARLDVRISQAAEKLEDYDLFVDSLGKCLVVATALWHPMFLCREYISAVVKSIVDANAEIPLIVTNHFEFYGDATAWGFNFTEQKFDFAISSDTIAVSGITVGAFLELVDCSGTF
jgi:hypothetical protein